KMGFPKRARGGPSAPWGGSAAGAGPCWAPGPSPPSRAISSRPPQPITGVGGALLYLVGGVVVEISPVGLPVPAVRAVIAADQVHRAAVFQQKNRLLLGQLQPAVFVRIRLSLFTEKMVDDATQRSLHRRHQCFLHPGCDPLV